MFFDRKNKKKCENCGHKSNSNSNFCPSCGNSFLDPRKEETDFGLLGRNDSINSNFQEIPIQGFGITDRLFSSVFNSLMKNLDKQFQNQFKEMEKDFQNAEIKTFPNGIRIKIAGPQIIQARQKKKARVRKPITTEQIKKISSLPKAEAKINVKRLGDKVVYELNTPGVQSVDDIFISKLESGYEVKALGSKKVYVNSIPVNLPISKYSILDNKLFVEFNSGFRQGF